MKKTILTLAMISSLANAVELEYLTGDTRLACEAMLCLASPIKPTECSTAIAKFFSIKFKKPHQTIQARKNFLNLCPVDNSDSEMLKYKNDILANLDGECSLESLNKRIEKKLLRIDKEYGREGEYIENHVYGYRINPELTKSCYLLQSSAYTNYSFSYVCDKRYIEDKFWNKGYELVKITEQEYNNLPDNLREKEQKSVNLKWQWVYYKKIPINKQCWVEKKN